ncbi:MAG: S8 family serine peptidase [Kangiellaceae bacterium]|jgi:subtilisin
MKLRTNKKLVASLVVAALTTASGSVLAADTTNVIVKLKNSNAPFAALNQTRTPESMKAMSQQRGASVRAFADTNQIEAKHVYKNVYYGFSASVTADQMKSLQNNPDVIGVYPDVTYRIVDIPENYTPPVTSKMNRKIIDWPQTVPQGPAESGSADSAYTGAGQHVYVIDTGIDVAQNDIKNNLGASYAAEVCADPVNCDADYDDDHSHGTHVAGTVAAADNSINVVGVAPAATVHAVKVCTAEGSCPSSSILDGLDWAVADMTDRGMSAIANLSLGGSDPSDKGTCDETGYTGEHAVAESYCNAAHAGMVVVVAAGNSASDAVDYAPAGYDSTITVSSYTSYDDLFGEAVFTGFSNYGQGPNDFSSNDSGVITIAAPGNAIVSLNRTHAVTTLSGTSMASPAVAGAAAMIMEKHPQAMDYSAFVNVRQMLVDNATMPVSYTVDDGSAAPHAEGLLNVRFLDEE